MTRAHNSFYNSITTLFSSALIALLNFIVRTVFIRTLGADYLGIESTFSNILSLLSLADLGFEAAIAYELYAPLEHKDFTRVHALMDLYRSVYRVIGCVVFGVGVCLIPVLPHFVKDYALFDQLSLNAIVIYLLYLFNSASYYWFFSYKATLLSAAQKSYILTILGYGVSIACSVAQILALVVARSFMLFLIAQIVFTILRRLLSAVICDRRFPFLKEKSTVTVSREERKRIFKDCYAIFFHRMNGTILNASDTLVLTSMVGFRSVGLYGNYLSIRAVVYSVVGIITSSLHASMGSIFASKNKDWARLLYRSVQYITSWFYGVGAIGIALLANEFIDLWIGQSFVVTTWERAGQLVATPVALLVGVELYLTGYANVSSLFRNSSGLFYKLRFRPILSILVNLIVSVLTVPYLGMAGCVVGTIVSLLSGDILIDALVINRDALEQSSAPFFLRFALYAAIMAGAGLLCAALCGRILLPGIPGFILRGAVCVVVPSAIFLALTFRTQEFRYIFGTVKSLLGRRKA